MNQTSYSMPYQFSHQTPQQTNLSQPQDNFINYHNPLSNQTIYQKPVNYSYHQQDNYRTNNFNHNSIPLNQRTRNSINSDLNRNSPFPSFGNTMNSGIASLNHPTGLAGQIAANSLPYNYEPLTSFAPKSFMKSKLFSGGIASTIQTAQKGLNTANQIIPIVNQIRPVWTNARTMFKVAKAVNNMEDLNWDNEIDQAIKTPKEEVQIVDVIDKKEINNSQIESINNTNQSLRIQPTINHNQINENLPTIF